MPGAFFFLDLLGVYMSDVFRFGILCFYFVDFELLGHICMHWIKFTWGHVPLG